MRRSLQGLGYGLSYNQRARLTGYFKSIADLQIVAPYDRACPGIYDASIPGYEFLDMQGVQDLFQLVRVQTQAYFPIFKRCLASFRRPGFIEDPNDRTPSSRIRRNHFQQCGEAP